MKRLKYFKNVTATSADFYVYGEIVDEKEPDFWTGEVSTTAVDTNDVKTELEELQKQGVRDLNIYINSPGGSVFAASTIISLFNRFKMNSGAKIHSFIDGVAASAASFLALVADDVNIYKNSIMMIHKPWSFAIGDSEDMQKEADLLESLEDNTMIPLYMDKAKVDEAEIKDLIAAETWFNGNKDDELFIGNFFEVNYLDQTKTVAACASKRLFNKYQHVPAELKNLEPEKEEKPVEKPVEKTKETQEKPVENHKEENLDYSEFDGIIKSIKH